jgi:hypothetical protein
VIVGNVGIAKIGAMVTAMVVTMVTDADMMMADAMDTDVGMGVDTTEVMATMPPMAVQTSQ